MGTLYDIRNSNFSILAFFKITPKALAACHRRGEDVISVQTELVKLVYHFTQKQVVNLLGEVKISQLIILGQGVFICIFY